MGGGGYNVGYDVLHSLNLTLILDVGIEFVISYNMNMQQLFPSGLIKFYLIL